jgi:hypothetical protein
MLKLFRKAELQLLDVTLGAGALEDYVCDSVKADVYK